MRRRPLLMILLIAALLRVGLLAFSAGLCDGDVMTPDSHGYLDLARGLIETGRFGSNSDEIFRTPGYPLMLTVTMGERNLVVLASVFQIGLDVLLVYVTYLLGTALCERRVGLVAAGLHAVSPLAIASSVRILSDGPFAMLLTVAVLLLVRHFKTRTWRPLLAAAVVSAAACYVRPAGQVLIVVAILALLLPAGRLKFAPAFAGVAVGLLLPWVARNAVRAEYCGFSSFATDSAYRFALPPVIARAERISEDEAWARLAAAEAADAEAHPDWSSGDFVRARARRTRQAMQQHTALYARVHLAGTAAFWLPGVTDALELIGVTSGQRGTLAVLRQQGLWAGAKHYFGGSAAAIVIATPAVLLLVAYYAFMLVAAGRYLRLRMPASHWLMLLTVLVWWLSGGVAATPRFRAAVAPLLSVAAAAGVVLVIDRLRRRRARQRRHAGDLADA